MSRFPDAILLRLLAGRILSSMADACLHSAKRRIEARKRREERAAQVAAFSRATCGRRQPAGSATGAAARVVAARRCIYVKATKTEAAMKAPQRFIYVIGPLEGAQKVGFTTDLKSRLAALQTACSQELMLHAAVRVPFDEAHAIERRAHQLLQRSHVKNEWFDLLPSRAIVAVLQAAKVDVPSHAGVSIIFREAGQLLLPYPQPTI